MHLVWYTTRPFQIELPRPTVPEIVESVSPWLRFLGFSSQTFQVKMNFFNWELSFNFSTFEQISVQVPMIIPGFSVSEVSLLTTLIPEVSL